MARGANTIMPGALADWTGEDEQRVAVRVVRRLHPRRRFRRARRHGTGRSVLVRVTALKSATYDRGQLMAVAPGQLRLKRRGRRG